MFAADNYDHRAIAESRRCVLRVYSVVRNAKVRAMYHLRLLPSIFLIFADTSVYARIRIHLVVSYYSDKVIRLGACIDHW